MGTDFLTAEVRSDVMSRVRSEGTGPEVALGRALRRLGARPKTNVSDLPGKPDFVFARARLACFVDGELWHGGQWRRRGLGMLQEQFGTEAKRSYWVPKIQANTRRDLRNTAALLDDGWGVLRLWAGEVERDPAGAAELVLAARDGAAPVSRLSGSLRARAADFFAGIGLMSAGLAGAGWRTVWANDFDPMKQRLFLHNHREGRVELERRAIQEVPSASVPRVGVMSACFPCTDISLAGAGRGIEKGEQSSAFLRFAEMLSEFAGRRPPFVVLENVPALLTSHGGRDFRICLERLGDAGYDVDAMVVDARHFVPQSRPRMFVVGVRNDVGRLVPAGSHPTLGSPLRPERFLGFVRSSPDLPWGIRAMPEPPSLKESLVDVLEEIPYDSPVWWSPKRVAYLRRQVSDRHRGMVRDGVRDRGVVWATGFRRMRKGRSMAELRFDGIAGCLRTPKGGSAKQILVRADRHGWRVRLLTPVECARLMGVGDFRIDAEGVSTDDALFGFGDAVVAPAVTWVVENYINPIAAELIRGRLLKLSERELRR